MSELVIASMMICPPPKYLGGKLMLSGCDAVWEAVEELPEEIKIYFTDDVGNESVKYGGHLQIVDLDVLNLLEKHNFFACFRCVEKRYLDRVQTYPPTNVYTGLERNLHLIGWDIATGNGWLSASCHGCFPVDPFTGNALDQNISKLNNFGLFAKIDDCKEYCQINDIQVPEHAPWFPLAICVDQSSYSRLREMESQLVGCNK